jgi:hypothetical protein
MGCTTIAFTRHYSGGNGLNKRVTKPMSAQNGLCQLFRFNQRQPLHNSLP